MTNEERALSAKRCVKLFADLTGGEMNSPSENIADLICNLGHLCDTLNLNFPAHAAHGIGMWSAEKRDVEPVSNDLVTITITQRGV